MPELAASNESRGSAEAADNRGSASRDQHRSKRALGAFEGGVDADRGLVESLQRGEAHAAEDLVDKFGDRAYRLAIRICGKEQDAEEVVQDAFFSVIRYANAFRGEAAFASWLYRIVANAAYQNLRSRRRTRTEVSLNEALPVFDDRGRHVGPVEDWSDRLAGMSTHAELRMTLASAIEELPVDARTVFLLRDVEGLSIREIADALSLSAHSVKARAHRARLFLRKRLGGVVVPGGGSRGNEGVSAKARGRDRGER